MIPVLSREQIRAFDRYAIEQCRVPSLVLMENAGRAAAGVLEASFARGDRFVVVCGGGNNGGDGFVVARRLRTRGFDVSVVLLANEKKLRGDAADNHAAWVGLGRTVARADADLGALDAELSRGDVIVDGLFGTGLDREITGRYRDAIERINASSARRVALDIPSGIDADTGAVFGVAVRAEVTITFAHLKLGLVTCTGAEHAGRLEVVDIGVPADLVEAVGHDAEVVESLDVAALLSRRPLATHKGSAGRVLAIAGSLGKTGAALLVGRGALRAGAGLVTLCTFVDAADALDRRVLEEMTARIDPLAIEASLEAPLSACDVVAVGPGLGLDDRARRVVDHVLFEYDGVKVVDADAITHLAGRAESLRRAKGTVIVTPHPGEMARLLEISTRAVEADRFGAVRRAVEATGATVLLKGARTIVGAPGRLPVVNRSGTPALATAGSGDVLCGIAAALCCTVGDASAAAYAAAHVHGLSGQRWAESGRDRGLLAREIADGVPSVLASLTRPGGPLPD